MKNKKIYEDKIKPLSSLLINYYGEEYKDRINHNFDNLVYNFDDIFTSSYDILSSNPSVVKGLIENLGFIKAKDKYNLLLGPNIQILLIFYTSFNPELIQFYQKCRWIPWPCI